jgi:hypothetical protein
MPSEPCTWIDEHVEALFERPPPAHLSGCARCHARFQALDQALDRAFNPPPVPVPPELEARILAAVAARSRKRRPSIFRPAAFGLAFAGAAIAVTLALWPKPPMNGGAPHVKLPDEPTGPVNHKPTGGCTCAF